MPNLYNSGQLATIIKKLGENDIEDLGADDDSKNTFIFYYLNIAMWKLARLAYNVANSDAKNLTTDGYVTFQRNGADIADLFEPLMIFDPNGRQVMKRSADDAPIGWWREAQNMEVHIKGFSAAGAQKLPAGNYQLKYIKYPKQVTLPDDAVEFPPSGYDSLIKEVLALIKYSKNSYAGAQYMETGAKTSYGAAAQGAQMARGPYQPVGKQDVTDARGG